MNAVKLTVLAACFQDESTLYSQVFFSVAELFFFVRASVVSYVMFVLSLFVPHLSFFRCLGRAVLCDCGNSWLSLLIFLSTPQHLYNTIVWIQSINSVS